MKSNELTHIQYEKATDLGSGSKGEITERYVIPTFVPQPNMKALDVTELTEAEREEMAALFSEYSEYYKQQAKNIFTFEDWLSHTRGDDTDVEIKWRTFRMANVEVLD